MSFFFIDRENVPSNLLPIFQIFNKLIAHAKDVFKIDNYVATEYAMTAILRETKGIDVMNVYKQINQTINLISAPLSNSAKIKIIQKIISQINNENIDASETEVITRLTKKEGMSEIDAKSSLEKALQLGAIIKKDTGTLSLIN